MNYLTGVEPLLKIPKKPYKGEFGKWPIRGNLEILKTKPNPNFLFAN